MIRKESVLFNGMKEAVKVGYKVQFKCFGVVEPGIVESITGDGQNAQIKTKDRLIRGVHVTELTILNRDVAKSDIEKRIESLNSEIKSICVDIAKTKGFEIGAAAYWMSFKRIISAIKPIDMSFSDLELTLEFDYKTPNGVMKGTETRLMSEMSINKK